LNLGIVAVINIYAGANAGKAIGWLLEALGVKNFRKSGPSGGAWMYNPEIREGTMEIPADIMALFVGPHSLGPAANTLWESRSGGA